MSDHEDTDGVRQGYVLGLSASEGMDYLVSGPMFDRWLESVKNEAHNDGYDECYAECVEGGCGTANRAKVGEARPWEQAKDGEIWGLDNADSIGQYLVLSSRFFLLPMVAPGEAGWAPASYASDFNDGVRLWPEVDSQKETQ